MLESLERNECKTCRTVFWSSRPSLYCGDDCRNPVQNLKALAHNDCEVCQKPTKDRRSRFCSIQCANVGKDAGKRYAALRSWLPCSTCLGRVGFGMCITARQLAITTATVHKAWKDVGFKPDLPKERNWQAATGQTHNAGKCQTPAEKLESYYRSGEWKWAIMAEYRREKAASRRPDVEWGKKAASLLYIKYLQSNPLARVKHNLRTRLRARVRRVVDGIKRNRMAEVTGCTSDELKRHIESQFDKTMSWENYGTRWEIDHIVPMSRYNLASRSERYAVNHFTNLRPMEVRANRRKSAAKGTDIQQRLLL